MGRTVAVLLGVSLLVGASTARGDRLLEAGQAYAAGQYSRVLVLLAKPGDAPSRLLRARALLQSGSHADAAKLLSGLHKQLPRLGDLVLLLRGEALAGAGRHQQAATALRAAIKWKGSRFEDRGRLQLARALAAGGQPRQAVRAYNGLLRLYAEHPERPTVELELALAMERSGWRSEAARRILEIWLRWPQTAAAVKARAALDRMRAARVKLKQPAWWRRIKRIRILRRHKLYARVEAELLGLRKLHHKSPGQMMALDNELARTYLRMGQRKKALPLLQALVSRYPGRAPRQLRWMLADCLADLGQLDQGVALLTRDAIITVGRGRRARKRIRGGRVEDVIRAELLLAKLGRYKQALKLVDQLSPQLSATAFLKGKRTWLAYRSGQHDRAIKGLDWLNKRARGFGAYVLYWKARAHARAGRAARAEALYRELLEKHLRSYYGILARSRLVEAGKLKLEARRCSQPHALPGEAAVPARLAALVSSHGQQLPRLARAQALWRLGFLPEARRELRLLGVELLWIRYRGRHKHWIIRPSLERIWRGAPVPRRRWNKRAFTLYQEGHTLRLRVGRLLRDAGVFYLGWRLGYTGREPANERFPRAYQGQVLARARQHRLDPNMVWAIMRTESSYRPDAVSPVDATGLMQIMPYTGRLISESMKLTGHRHSLLFEPAHNLRMSSWYLRQVLDKFQGQLPLVAAAYNGGPHNVARWLSRRGAGMVMDEFIEEMSFRQSRLYAKKIIRLMALYERVHCGKDDLVLGNKLDPGYKVFPTF